LPGWQPAVDVPGSDAFHGVPALIIDDNATTRGILSELALRWKMKPYACDSGEAGLQALARAAEEGIPYRLLLLDERMPAADGFTVIERMRRDKLQPAAVVMMLDAGDRVASIARCRQLDLHHYVIKPVFAAELFACTRLALGLRTATEPTALPDHAIPASQRSLRILLADDNLVNRKVATAMLGKMGHHITLATNGREAVERWRQDDFDLILMDVQMPEMNGLQATMQIRREEGSRHMPIVAMTASAMKEDRDRCMAAGMDNFISKPVSSRAIEQVISETFPQLSRAEAPAGP